jgi:ferritin-like metal-binding protein YciE
METLADFLKDELRDIYGTVGQLSIIFAKMAGKASAPALRAEFNTHLRETHNQIIRLEAIGEELDIELTGSACEAIAGIVGNATEVLDNDIRSSSTDATLIDIARQIDQYEIAAYTAAFAMAKGLGHVRVAHFLQETIDEKSAAGRELARIAAAIGTIETAVPLSNAALV